MIPVFLSFRPACLTQGIPVLKCYNFNYSTDTLIF